MIEAFWIYSVITAMMWGGISVFAFCITLHELVDFKKHPNRYKSTLEEFQSSFRNACKALVATPFAGLIIMAISAYAIFYEFLFKKIFFNVKPYVGAAINAWR